ncbi:TatD family hydrolase [Suicoccus acidiformans]|uniref:TatD family hydrolase n=1 Tax=Suicoccus acidiformans TaxID=2036206 RepID=UPI0013C2A180|nr:TatD family hydrolase [Suicoccus acidiformans]
MLLDTHFHLDFIKSPEERQQFLSLLKALDVGIVAQTVLPTDFFSLLEELKESNTLLSLGYHPWWIQSDEQIELELAAFRSGLTKTRFIGEIGLDFSPKILDQASQDRQIAVLSAIFEAIIEASQPKQLPYILSLHTVRSAQAVLDLLEHYALPTYNVLPVFHRFNGTNDELFQLRRLGAYLSVNPLTLNTKKGRAYLQQMPADRLLLESDWPKQAQATFGQKQLLQLADDLADLLKETCDYMSELRGEDMTQQILHSQNALYFAN